MNLLESTDGKVWAEEFCKRFPECEMSDVLGWFCNAIMVGYDAGRELGAREGYFFAEDFVRNNCTRLTCKKWEDEKKRLHGTS
jgi:hypothetical protein